MEDSGPLDPSESGIHNWLQFVVAENVGYI